MRQLLFITALFAAMFCIEKPAGAQNYPWCAIWTVSQCADELRFCNLSAVPRYY